MSDEITPEDEQSEDLQTPEELAESAGTRVTTDGGIPWGLGFFLVVTILLVIFAVQNTQEVDLQFLGWQVRSPLVVIIVVVAAVAIILDEILGGVLRRRRRRRRAEKEELKRLRSQRT